MAEEVATEIEELRKRVVAAKFSRRVLETQKAKSGVLADELERLSGCGESLRLSVDTHSNELTEEVNGALKNATTLYSILTGVREVLDPKHAQLLGLFGRCGRCVVRCSTRLPSSDELHRNRRGVGLGERNSAGRRKREVRFIRGTETTQYNSLNDLLVHPIVCCVACERTAFGCFRCALEE